MCGVSPTDPHALLRLGRVEIRRAVNVEARAAAWLVQIAPANELRSFAGNPQSVWLCESDSREIVIQSYLDGSIRDNAPCERYYPVAHSSQHEHVVSLLSPVTSCHKTHAPASAPQLVQTALSLMTCSAAGMRSQTDPKG
jgi:hypothetical protein